MPTNQERKRKVLRYRTIKPTPTTYIHIAIVKKKGKRGGRTVAGKVHELAYAG